MSIPCKPFEPAADRFATGIHRVRKGRNGKNQANKGGYNCKQLYILTYLVFGCYMLLPETDSVQRCLESVKQQPFILSCKCNVHTSICSTIGPCQTTQQCHIAKWNYHPKWDTYENREMVEFNKNIPGYPQCCPWYQWLGRKYSRDWNH